MRRVEATESTRSSSVTVPLPASAQVLRGWQIRVISVKHLEVQPIDLTFVMAGDRKGCGPVASQILAIGKYSNGAPTGSPIVLVLLAHT